MEILTIVALILGPILAIQIQKLIERKTEKHIYRKNLFQTLMATRGYRLSRRHVEALNMIELLFSPPKYFYKNKYKNVIEAWENYFDVLSDKDFRKKDEAGWENKFDEQFVELLAQMSTSLNYQFSAVEIKRKVYSPEAHGKVEMQNLVIREMG